MTFPGREERDTERLQAQQAGGEQEHGLDRWPSLGDQHHQRHDERVER